MRPVSTEHDVKGPGQQARAHLGVDERRNADTAGAGRELAERLRRSLELDPAFAGGTVMGKRYVDEGGAELLVTKAGQGTLTVGETPLSLKEAKPLPASD